MNKDDDQQQWVITRRTFLKSSAIFAGSMLVPFSCTPSKETGKKQGGVRFGIVADCHYADIDTKGARCYRDSLDKLSECVELMNAQKVDFLVELGDLKDQDTPPVEEKTLSYLSTIEKVFCRFNGPRYHVLGNHDIDSLSKEQFLANVTNTGIDTGKNYYSYDFNGIHFVVLDANYKSDRTDYDHGNFIWTDPNVPPAELNWLRQDLGATNDTVIIMIHQPLDAAGNEYIKNADEVRQILEQSGKVAAVFQGHRHQGGYNLIEGIHYYTLKGMIEGAGPENNTYAIVEIHPGSGAGITITGYRKAVSSILTI